MKSGIRLESIMARRYFVVIADDFDNLIAAASTS
jgi:hypothetical protein